ncbi:MAG: chromosome partitioning protein [Gammaproteobacteria bacterium]|nr:MAG: chromosome partitioning protein [Gammaproteobacteria bacterium]TND01603.1 MAG: chromosome partitioning protein [Gammaproteobacteria bacterium]
MSIKKPLIVAIANPKGGVGKSTTTANLAAVAARHGLKVLLFDLDPQASASDISGVNEDAITSFASAMFGEASVLPSSIAVETSCGYDIIPAGSDLITAEDMIGKLPMGEQRLSLLIDSDTALSKYDLILIDTVGARWRLLTACLMATDNVIVPLRPSRLSVKELPDLLELIRYLTPYRGKKGPISIRGLFFTEVDERTVATKININDVRATVGDDQLVMNTMIPKSTVIEQAALVSQPVVLYDAHCGVSRAYEELFVELFPELLREQKSA